MTQVEILQITEKLAYWKVRIERLAKFLFYHNMADKYATVYTKNILIKEQHSSALIFHFMFINNSKLSWHEEEEVTLLVGVHWYVSQAMNELMF